MPVISSATDSELIQLVCNKEAKALEALYNRYSAILYTLIKKIVIDEEIAQDILSDVFVIIWKKADLFDFISNDFYAWLITIARNKAVDKIRRLRNSSESEPYNEKYENENIIPSLSKLIDPLDLETANNMKISLEEAFNKLTNAQQYVISLAYYEGLTQNEIAQRLNIPVSTVKSKIKIALSNLKDNLNMGNNEMGNINDLIYAYSLGCLDPEDHQKFINLYDSELDFKLLGEYQNLVSLLPIILTIETPDPLLKDNVAKKLYGLKEQGKTVIPSIQDLLNENDSPETVSTSNVESIEYNNAADEQQPDDPAGEEKNVSQEINNTLVKDHYDISSVDKESENNEDQIFQNNNSNLTGYRGYPPRYSDLANKGTNKLIWGIILFGLLSVGLFIAYMLVSTRTNELNKEVEQLKSEVFQLNLQLKTTREMQDIVQSPNVFAINLISTDLNKSGFGKLFIDSVKGLGYIQLGQMPIIPEDEAYQLWAKLSDGFKSLGTFHVLDKGGYYSFTIPTLSYEENIIFFITEEPASGSTYPGNDIYLQGSYNP